MAASSSRLGSGLETLIESNEDENILTKREKLQIMIEKKRKCDLRAKKIVHSLIETSVDKNYLLESAGYLSISHWEDVVEERKLSGICGWVLCDKELKNIPKQQFSIRRNTVLDITERKSFCCSHCYAVSNHFKKQILITPLWMRGEEEIPEFSILDDETQELHGIQVSLTGINLNDEDEKKSDHESDSNDEEDAQT